VPLNLAEWEAVLVISLPVIFIDEALKYITRTCISKYIVIDEYLFFSGHMLTHIPSHRSTNKTQERIGDCKILLATRR